MRNIPTLNKAALVFLFCLLYHLSVHAQNDKPIAVQDSVKKKKSRRLFELSLGQSLLFISDHRLERIKNDNSVIVPTSAKLFFAEFRPVKLMRIPVFFNLPTETKQFIVDGQLVNERASPTLGAGLEFRIFKVPLGVRSALELEVGPLASFLLSEHNTIRFAPIAAGRLRFIKNEDFVIYFGSSYSAGINCLGILFGIGYVF